MKRMTVEESVYNAKMAEYEEEARDFCISLGIGITIVGLFILAVFIS